MIELIAFSEKILKQVGRSGIEEKQKLIAFLEDNQWFDQKPSVEQGKVMLSFEQVELFTAPLLEFFKTDEDTKHIKIISLLTKKFPETSEKFNEFVEEAKVSKETVFYVADFLLYYLKKDLFLMSDSEVSALLTQATNKMIKAHGDTLTFFLSWLKANYRTVYRNEYVMKNRYTMEESNMAYDFDEYLQLLYYLFNEDYIRDNEMYSAAARSKNYADTWLFLSLHFICSLRTTDMLRIMHPFLPDSPCNILKDIEEGNFSEAHARSVLLSINTRLCVLPLTPNKTAAHQNVSQVKFIVPETCEVHIGILFALCEAHRCNQAIPDETPLIRRISDYDRISRYMGDDIGSLFLESNFRSRSANKSYLQAVYMLSDDILEDQRNDLTMRGYTLASLARSHKGQYSQFAQTTAIYLKDAKTSGLTPEFVAKELFERGVLSFIPSMLLKMITDGAYKELSFENQTQLIQTLNLSPREVESTVSLTMTAKHKSEKVIHELLTSQVSEEDILAILHRIATGEAFSKQAESLCLLSAIRKVCPYDSRAQCIGCQYEIKTKSTMFLLASEFKRLKLLHDSASSELEKRKYKVLITETVLPCLDEVLTCLKEVYGEEVFRAYESVIKETIK